MKFQRKAAPVDAIQFDGTEAGARRIAEFAGTSVEVSYGAGPELKTSIRVTAGTGGTYALDPTMWLIRDAESFLSLTTDALFRRNYEPRP